MDRVTGFSSSTLSILSFGMFSSPVRLEDQVAIDDHPDWKSGSDRQRWLYIEITADHLLARLVQGIRGTQPQRLKDTRIVAAVGSGTEFGSHAKEG